MYRANVVVEVTGNWGGKGKLEIRLWESEDGNQPVDLNAEIPRRPRYPFTYRIAHWEDSNGKKTKLVTKKQSAVLEPVKKKKANECRAGSHRPDSVAGAGNLVPLTITPIE